MNTRVIHIQQACKQCQICGKLRYSTKERMMLLHENTEWGIITICRKCFNKRVYKNDATLETK